MIGAEVAKSAHLIRKTLEIVTLTHYAMGKLSNSQLAKSTCVVRCCPKQDQTSFFRIPTARKDDWIRICGLDPKQLNTLSRVCNLHFRDEDYFPGSLFRKRLRPDVVPSQWVPIPDVTGTAEVLCEEEKAVEGPQLNPSSNQSENQHTVDSQEGPPAAVEDLSDNSLASVDSLPGHDQEVMQDSPGGPLSVEEDLFENLNNNSDFETLGKFTLN